MQFNSLLLAIAALSHAAYASTPTTIEDVFIELEHFVPGALAAYHNTSVAVVTPQGTEERRGGCLIFPDGSGCLNCVLKCNEQFSGPGREAVLQNISCTLACIAFCDDC